MDQTATPIWLKYAEFEIRNKYINRARNVYDRAVTICLVWINFGSPALFA